MEVVATLRFLTPSLGNARGERRDRMLYSTEGEVVYLQSWWRSSLGYAAQALCRHQGTIDKIQADPVVRGPVSIHKRFYSPTSFKEHEAFLAGTEVEVRFMLPKKLRLEAFRELLETAGKYAGISPYGYKQDYGRFIVVDVRSGSNHKDR